MNIASRIRSHIKIVEGVAGQGALTEAYDTTVRFRFATGAVDVDVHRNPSKGEFLRLLQATRFKTMRGTITTTGDLLVWDATDATHHDMIQNHPEGSALDTNSYLYLHRDGFHLNDLNWMLNEGDGPEEYRYRSVLRRIVASINANAALRRIYGAEVDAPLGIDNETDERVRMTPEWIEANVVPGRQNVLEDEAPGSTIKLTDLYDEDELWDESEALHGYVDEADLERDFAVLEMSPQEARTFLTPRGDMTVIEAFEEFASKEQKRLVKQKVARYDRKRIIVVAVKVVLDGNHHLIAGILANQPIRYIDLGSEK